MRPGIALRTLCLGGLAVLAGACGGSSSTTTPPGYVISISGLAFSPLNLEVPPGATVTVVNRDGMGHSVTSEATANSFVPAAVSGIAFDTGVFQGTATFQVPASAAEGTVVPYYCRSHLATMATPNGSVTIRAAALPNGGGAAGGSAY